MASLYLAKGRALREQWLKFIFWGTKPDFLSAVIGGAPITNLYLSLHSASPGEAGTQLTSEVGYTGYTRIAQLRTTGAGGWFVTEGSVGTGDWYATNNGELLWPVKTDAPATTITHVGIGTASSGAGTLLYFIPVPTPPGSYTLSQFYRFRIPSSGLSVWEE